MNAVEIEQAISDLAEAEFDPGEFPFAFLEAFGNKPATIRRLRSGNTNKSDISGVLQANHIHIKVAPTGEVSKTLADLRESPATRNRRLKVRFILATDGVEFEAEDLTTGETVACAYADFPNHFGVFLPLAGITTVKQIRENTFDVRATSRLNRLYVTLLQDNPDWATEERRHDMNHFMARLIFCFFAEDTDIFNGDDLFTATVAQMSARDGSNTHEVISEIFRAMDVKPEDRATSGLRPWANVFPYVNGELFSGSTDVPRFSRIAQKYLLHIGNLDWKQINPDIFGSMIQAVADEEERSALGMHYTSVPNILKVLNPLFLDDLRASLEEAGDNPRKLLNLRKRMSNIRVFDPACGSGNFLVIAYKQMREIEAQINERRGEKGRPTDIPLTNFRGIELRDFSAEIARLALIIAEYQCDVLYRGPKVAREAFLPLDAQNWVTCGNALRLDWLSICPPTGTGVKMQSDDLFGTPLDQAEIDFENEGGETYICGNPPYIGKGKKQPIHKEDMKFVFEGRIGKWGYIDYVGCWFVKAADYLQNTPGAAAFVATNSISQGHQATYLWPYLFDQGIAIRFAYTAFRWSNLAARNAGVTVVVAGISFERTRSAILFTHNENDDVEAIITRRINEYLVTGDEVRLVPQRKPLSILSPMRLGNMVYDDGNLTMDKDELERLDLSKQQKNRFIRRIFGSDEFLYSKEKYCLWISDDDLSEAESIAEISDRISKVREFRASSRDKSAQKLSEKAHQFREMHHASKLMVAMPRISSEARPYLPAGVLSPYEVVSDLCYALYDAPLWNLAVLLSRTHLVWIATVCGKLETRYRYSSALGWNTFAVPKLTEKNRADLTRCAEDILLTREAHFPATIADLYDPEKMPDDLRAAHDRNDEVLERIYIGRRFKNDTERLEKLFEMYTRMTTKVPVR